MSNQLTHRAYRCWPVYALAASVPVSMAAISLSKLTLVLVAFGVLLRGSQSAAKRHQWEGGHVVVVLLMLGALALSMTWSTAPWNIACIDLGKYAKLLLIVLVPSLIRTRAQAMKAFAWGAGVQIFILMSSCALALGIALPWVNDPILVNSNSVFHEYLHQSIMTAGFAALCWHLRREVDARWFRILAPALAALALFNVLFALKGRTGYIASLVVLASAIVLETKKQWRWFALAVPIMVVALALLTSTQFKERVILAATEAQAYQPGNTVPSSTGERLNLWYRSAQAIAERPWSGFGAGSWGIQYKRLDAGADPWYSGTGGNPHQEFLLWGVLLGVGGMALLTAFLFTLWRDASRLPQAHARAMKSIILLLAATGMFNCVLYDAEIGEYFCLTLGLLLALGRAQTGRSPTTSTAGAAT